MKRVIARAAFDCWKNPMIRLIEETLTDGSKVFNIEIGEHNNYHEVICDSREDMELRYALLLRCVSPKNEYPGELEAALDAAMKTNASY